MTKPFQRQAALRRGIHSEPSPTDVASASCTGSTPRVAKISSHSRFASEFDNNIKAELERDVDSAVRAEIMDAVFWNQDELINKRFPDSLFERLGGHRANISLVNDYTEPESSVQQPKDKSPAPTPDVVPSSDGETSNAARGLQADAEQAAQKARSSFKTRARNAFRGRRVPRNKPQASASRKSKISSSDSVLDNIFTHLCKEKVYNARGHKWRKWPKTNKTGAEDAVATCFNEIVDAVREFIGGSTEGGRENDLVFCSTYAHKPVPSDGAARKPDVILARRKYTTSTWGEMPSFGEIKTRIASQKELLVRLTDKARLIFGAQKARRFVLAFDLVDTRMRLWKFDRAGVLISADFDVNKEPKEFLRVILGMALGEDYYLGLDPSFTHEEGCEYVELNGKKYKILEVIQMDSVVRGRGTIALAVMDLETGEKYLMKDQWVDTSRRKKEFDMLKWVEDKEVKRVTRLESFQRVAFKIDDADVERDSTANDRITKEYSVETREHFRLLIKPYGERLVNFRSLKELVSLFKDYVEAIRDLYQAEVLHRDISPGNLIIVTEEDGSRRGYIIDFDYATSLDQSRTAQASLTGTLPFMAWEMLTNNGIGHKYYFDLESLFYSLLWICFTEAGPRLQGRRPKSDIELESTPLKYWCPTKADERAAWNTGHAKRSHMHDPDEFRSLFLEDASFPEYFKRLHDLLDGWRKILFRPKVPDVALPEELRPISQRQDIPAVFKSIVDVFEATLKELPDKDELLDVEDTEAADHVTEETHVPPEIETREQGESEAAQGGQPTDNSSCHDGLAGPDTDSQDDDERSEEGILEREADKAARIRLIDVRGCEPTKLGAGLTDEGGPVEVDLRKAVVINQLTRSRGTKRSNESGDEQELEDGYTSPTPQSKRQRSLDIVPRLA